MARKKPIRRDYVHWVTARLWHNWREMEWRGYETSAWDHNLWLLGEDERF